MEERKMILKMIEDGKITAEEGIKLLEAMEKEEPASQKVQKGAEGSLSTEVDWEKGNDYRNHRREEEPASSKLTSFFESAVQKIKDFDLDFNFGHSIDFDHIFQHRDLTPASLDIAFENGSITLEPWDEQDIRVECQARVYRAKDTEEARKIFLEETTFRVSEHKLLFHTKVKSIKVQATVYIPKKAYDLVKLYSFNGQIKGNNIKADTLDVNTLNGALRFDGVTAKKVLAESVNGVIEYRNLNVDIIDAKTVNGDVTLIGQAQDTDAETVNGSIRYELTELNESGYADLKAATGSINLFIPSSIRVEGKLKTNVGGISIGLAQHEVLEEKKEFVQKSLSFVGNQEASPRVKVNAVANTGSIHVKKGE